MVGLSAGNILGSSFIKEVLEPASQMFITMFLDTKPLWEQLRGPAPPDAKYWPKETKNQYLERMKKEGKALFKEVQFAAILGFFLNNTCRILHDRLNNAVKKWHWVKLGSTHPVMLLAFLLVQRYHKVSVRHPKKLINNEWVRTALVTVYFKGAKKMPFLRKWYKSKHLIVRGTHVVNKYKELAFEIDDYGRVRCYIVQESRALIWGKWLKVE